MQAPEGPAGLAGGDDAWFVDDDMVAAMPNDSFGPRWRILVVDDEEDIHAATRLALGHISYKKRGVELLSAYSGAQGYEMLRTHQDVALVLLDVVMETDDAGLRLVRKIRGELANQAVRIVLRTGQPGQAPEEQVIVEYDINDYKAKTELTQTKLFATVIASLRAYEGLLAIERNRIGLNKILVGSSNLYRIHSLQEFASGVLNQIGAVLDVGLQGVLCVLQDNRDGQQLVVMAATGPYAVLAEHKMLPADHEWLPLIEQALREKRSLFQHPVSVLFIHASEGHEFVIVLTPPWPLEELQRDLLGVFCDRIATAFDNLHLVEELQAAQKATVLALADLAETRDADTGGHVHRVCKLTEAIARCLLKNGKHLEELTPKFLSQVGLASMLHDIGKVATPDAVLLKPGVLTRSEREVMEMHVTKGQAVLARAASMVKGISYLTIGAQIAGGHHEHFDGGGYPLGSRGQDIPLSARIVSVVDVFDALVNRRPYKEPWHLPDVLKYIQVRSGRQFDPDVVDALLDFVDTAQFQDMYGGAPALTDAA